MSCFNSPQSNHTEPQLPASHSPSNVHRGNSHTLHTMRAIQPAPAIATHSYSLCGARHSNEDFHVSEVLDNHVFSVVCDGHGGSNLAQVLGEAFHRQVKETASTLPHDAPPACLAETLQTCLHSAVQTVDDTPSLNGQGSTVSALLLQPSTMTCATLQLGDGRVFAAHPSTGQICQAQVLYHMDYANPSSQTPCGTGPEPCITSSHTYCDSAERDRYATALHEVEVELSVVPRKDAANAERRVNASLFCTPKRKLLHHLVEPSRTIESLKSYPNWFVQENLHLLQRAPECTVWKLPENDVALFVTCDGFDSKLALPTVDKLAKCICDPAAYLAEGFLKDTCLGGWVAREPKRKKRWWDPERFVMPSDEAWNSEPLKHTQALVRQIAPDHVWKNAVDTSFENIQNASHREASRERLPCLHENAQEAIKVAANMAVLLGSDDNVTVEAILVGA